jgi:hypothetical protein
LWNVTRRRQLDRSCRTKSTRIALIEEEARTRRVVRPRASRRARRVVAHREQALDSGSRPRSRARKELGFAARRLFEAPRSRSPPRWRGNWRQRAIFAASVRVLLNPLPHPT